MSDPQVMWQVAQVAEDGVREVYAIPKNANRSEWVVSPVAGGPPETVSAADLAPTDEVALLLWHERQGNTDAAAVIVAVIGARYRAARDSAVNPHCAVGHAVGDGGCDAMLPSAVLQ